MRWSREISSYSGDWSFYHSVQSNVDVTLQKGAEDVEWDVLWADEVHRQGGETGHDNGIHNLTRSAGRSC